ncbi:MAG: hypothetical protein HY686_00790 [Chloroflexi bacterium]|nr:hypothetical protein [Chloroflexota bacterium]
MAEDHETLRIQIVEQLQRTAAGAVEIVAEARNGEEAIALALRPDQGPADVHGHH